MPSGSRSSPQGKWWPSSGPRAARSHSASVGSRSSAQSQYATASYQLTCTTGWDSRPSTVDPGPSGRRQSAPGTSRHHGAAATARVAGKSSGSSPANTNDVPISSAVVRYAVSSMKAAKSRLVTVWTPIT